MSVMRKNGLLSLLCALCPLLGSAEGLLAIDNPAKNEQQRQAFASVEAFEGNDQVAMRQYGGDWQGAYSPRTGTNIGLLAARAEAGVQWAGYRVGTLYRAEALVQANRDTSDLVRQYSTRTGYDVGRTYALDYQIKGFEATGLHISKSFQRQLGSHWRLDWGLGLSYLRGKRIKLETALGQIAMINAKDFDAGVNFNDTDSQIDVTDRMQFSEFLGHQNDPSGQGYSLDAGLVLRHQESGASIEFAIADLSGRMDWRNLPANVMSISNANKYYDSDGFVHFNRTVGGSNSYRNLSQTLDPKLLLAASYPMGDFKLQGAASYTQGYWFPQTGIQYRINPQWAVKADFDFRFNTLGLALQHRWFYLGLRMDGTNGATAKAYGLNAGINIPF